MSPAWRLKFHSIKFERNIERTAVCIRKFMEELGTDEDWRLDTDDDREGKLNNIVPCWFCYSAGYTYIWIAHVVHKQTNSEAIWWKPSSAEESTTRRYSISKWWNWRTSRKKELFHFVIIVSLLNDGMTSIVEEAFLCCCCIFVHESIEFHPLPS